MCFEAVYHSVLILCGDTTYIYGPLCWSNISDVGPVVAAVGFPARLPRKVMISAGLLNLSSEGAEGRRSNRLDNDATRLITAFTSGDLLANLIDALSTISASSRGRFVEA
jgi:hypothetical protein